MVHGLIVQFKVESIIDFIAEQVDEPDDDAVDDVMDSLTNGANPWDISVLQRLREIKPHFIETENYPAVLRKKRPALKVIQLWMKAILASNPSCGVQITCDAVHDIPYVEYV